MRRGAAGIAACIVLALLLATPGRAGEENVVARIAVSSSPAASTLGLSVVEGVMTFRGRDYLLTLRGAAASSSSVGSVSGLRRARDIEGYFRVEDGALLNESGVRVVFDPPLQIVDGRLQILVASRIYPRVSTGQGSRVE
jgi:hypothetical protein